MIRTLFIIAAAALVLCLASLGGAAALGSRDLAANDWTWIITDDGDADDIHFRRGSVGPDVTRTIAWSGGDTLVVDLSADVTYVQGDKPGVVVRGPEQAVQRVRLVDGRLTLEDDDDQERGYMRLGRNGLRIFSETEMLKITVTAPSVNSFRVAGSGDLTVEGYDQPSLALQLDGSGDVEVDGRASKLELRINGSGDAGLEGLAVADAVIDLAGSGEADVGPTGAVSVDISGSGDLNLTRRPASIQQDVTGSGEVDGI